ncbi:MFS transporter [Streptomyces somaliensis]|uniref:MFS transporter n=1 Tax=Streptomyces somaliensis (strain ATCC 33201 / DSM 40738 / JCM 12659 / KCTC 9044 / NCTC 11332 / NRRL B-12077 / IP 733) TaxID=1134445 RepID=A0AA44ID18_STRE0|nr:MFS transporter [Streptomyces somaliensis]NKY14017.1 MFS transporter [Streptomyces somaliensis DSM 40738]
MPSPYRAIFAAPGALGFSAAGLVGRMPLAMTGVGVLTMVTELSGRYGLAGLLTGTLALSAAVLGPQVSRLVDRYGQRRVLRPATLVSVTALGALVLCAQWGLPDWTLFACALTAGCVPSVGAMTRARWAEIYRGRPQELHTAYSLESIVDELCFILGPPLSIGLSTLWFPAAGPLLAGLFLLVGVEWLIAQRATEPAPHPPGEHVGARTSALRSPGLRVLVVAFVATGAIFGAVDVVTVAFAEEQGHKTASSLVLAVYAGGSCLAGAVFGTLRLKGSPARRWVVGVLAMAVSMIPLQLAGSLPTLALALFVAGLAIAPTMVTTMALVEAHVPRGQLTEGMTWTGTGLAVGVALGTSVSGGVVAAHGADAGYLVPGVAGALAAVVAFVGHRRLSRPVPTREGQRAREDSERYGRAPREGREERRDDRHLA